MGWRGLIRLPAPAAGTNKTSLPPSANRTAKKPAAGCMAYTSQTSRLGARDNGTKRARIGKASGSTDRSFGPDTVRYMSVTIATR